MNSEIANIRLIVGIGNPGTKYRNTYHNAGFSFLDFLAGSGTKWKRTDLFEYLTLGERILVKTNSLMNESGGSVAKVVSYFRQSPESLLVVHDDSDLMVGTYKLQFGRGGAGHRGVSSVIASLKTKNFWRARIGIRRKKEGPREKAGDFVLRKIDPSSRLKLEAAFRAVRDELGTEIE